MPPKKRVKLCSAAATAMKKMRAEEPYNEREERLAADRAATSAARTEEALQQREARLAAKQAGTSSSRAAETPPQREVRLAADRASTSAARTDETPQQREARLAADRARLQAAQKRCDMARSQKSCEQRQVIERADQQHVTSTRVVESDVQQYIPNIHQKDHVAMVVTSEDNNSIWGPNEEEDDKWLYGAELESLKQTTKEASEPTRLGMEEKVGSEDKDSIWGPNEEDDDKWLYNAELELPMQTTESKNLQPVSSARVQASDGQHCVALVMAEEQRQLVLEEERQGRSADEGFTGGSNKEEKPLSMESLLKEQARLESEMEAEDKAMRDQQYPTMARDIESEGNQHDSLELNLETGKKRSTRVGKKPRRYE